MNSWLGLAALLVALAASFGAGVYVRGEWDEGRHATTELGVQQAEQQRRETQSHEVLQAEVHYVDRTKIVERRLPAVTVDILDSCLHDGSAGIASMPGPDADHRPDGARGNPVAGWCERLAIGYAAGVRNTEKLALCREAIKASGGSKPQ